MSTVTQLSTISLFVTGQLSKDRDFGERTAKSAFSNQFNCSLSGTAVHTAPCILRMSSQFSEFSATLALPVSPKGFFLSRFFLATQKLRTAENRQ